jgi:GT2 family glycosyltransferase
MNLPALQVPAAQAGAGKDAARVAIVILNWNGLRDTLECLRSVLAASYPCLEIVVLENGSSDDSWQQLVDFCERAVVHHRIVECDAQGAIDTSGSRQPDGGHGKTVHLVRSPKNLGFCGGNNLGMAYGVEQGCDYLVVLNNDTVCDPGFIEPLVETASVDNRAGLVGGLIAYWDEPETVWWAGGTFDGFLETRRVGDGCPVTQYLGGGVRETDWVSGCMMLMPTAVYRQVGGFDERFFIWSEEWDQSLRVRAAGYRLYIDPRSRVYHKVGRSLGVMQPLSYYYGTRNRLLLKRKHLPGWRRSLFMSWFLPSRVLRYLQFLIAGRPDLAHAGFSALSDYFAGRTGIWSHQRQEAKP